MAAQISRASVHGVTGQGASSAMVQTHTMVGVLVEKGPSSRCAEGIIKVGVAGEVAMET